MTSPYCCFLCLKEFKSTKSRDSHIVKCLAESVTCVNDSNYSICAHCGFSCHDVFELGMHYGLVHPHVDMSKICGICGITSSNESGLIKHKQIHSNFNTKHMSITRFSCPTCSVSFCDPIQFKEHIICEHENLNSTEKTHERTRNMLSKQWKCKICPNYSSSTGHEQRKHNLQFHKEIFEYYCQYCGMLYSSSSRVRIHTLKCRFREAIRKDESGLNYIRLWNQVARNEHLKTKMAREGHDSIINRFLITEKPREELLSEVPLL